jgi:type I restriction enzyme, S subunit
LAASATLESKSLHIPAAHGEPPKGWTWSRLDDVSEGVFDCPHSTPKLTDTGPFVVRTQDIITGIFRADQAGRVSEQTYTDRIARVTPSHGDLLYSREGTYFGIAAEVPPNTRVCLGQRMVLIRPDNHQLDFSFLCHWLNSPTMAAHIHGYRDGTVAERLNLPTIRALPILIPPLGEQKAIAAVLGALDDKIELNRRMNATLQAMARALFQSWFVDFDPARAKLDGRKPTGLDDATAALFPDTFQDSEAGHIPKGWTVGKVGDLSTFSRAALNPGDFPAETFDHFSLPAFDAGRTPKVEPGSAIMSNKLVVTPDSLLLSKLNPHIPRIWLPDLHPSRRSVCSTEFMVACSKPGVSREYLFSLFANSAFASVYGTLVTGTTGSHQRIRPESVLDMKIVIPSAALIRAFTDIAKPMFDRINRNTEQSRTLSTLRDTLLPKLLTGTVRLAPRAIG